MHILRIVLEPFLEGTQIFKAAGDQQVHKLDGLSSAQVDQTSALYRLENLSIDQFSFEALQMQSQTLFILFVLCFFLYILLLTFESYRHLM